jgi:hypothetical protein
MLWEHMLSSSSAHQESAPSGAPFADAEHVVYGGAEPVEFVRDREGALPHPARMSVTLLQSMCDVPELVLWRKNNFVPQ